MNIEIIKEGLEIKGARLELTGLKHCIHDVRKDGESAILCVSKSTLMPNDKYGLDKAFQKCIELGIYEAQQVELTKYEITNDGYLTYIIFPKSVLGDLEIDF